MPRVGPLGSLQPHRQISAHQRHFLHGPDPWVRLLPNFRTMQGMLRLAAYVHERALQHSLPAAALHKLHCNPLAQRTSLMQANVAAPTCRSGHPEQQPAFNSLASASAGVAAAQPQCDPCPAFAVPAAVRGHRAAPAPGQRAAATPACHNATRTASSVTRPLHAAWTAVPPLTRCTAG